MLNNTHTHISWLDTWLQWWLKINGSSCIYNKLPVCLCRVDIKKIKIDICFKLSQCCDKFFRVIFLLWFIIFVGEIIFKLIRAYQLKYNETLVCLNHIRMWWCTRWFWVHTLFLSAHVDSKCSVSKCAHWF